MARVLLALAAAYALVLTLPKDPTDAQVTTAYKKVALKVHPDKGGAVEDAQRLTAAKREWDDAKKAAGRPGEGGGTHFLYIRKSHCAKSRRVLYLRISFVIRTFVVCI